MAIFRVMSLVVITVPIRGSLALETMVSFVSVVGTCDRITKKDVYKQILLKILEWAIPRNVWQ